MAKEQRRGVKEARKPKDPANKGKKVSGPKYLRAAETLSIGKDPSQKGRKP